jgi:Ca2+-transporting ATPase
MLGLDNPLNPMQILFINILMDGPPSQSLGVDPVDPAIMCRPPRKKNAPIITRKLLLRVLFSASIIVFGTLFVYIYAYSDQDMSRREQTMVSFLMSFFWIAVFFFSFFEWFVMRETVDGDLFLLCLK